MTDHRGDNPKGMKEHYPYKAIDHTILHRDRSAHHDEIAQQTKEFLANKANAIQVIPKRSWAEVKQAYHERKAVVSPGTYGR